MEKGSRGTPCTDASALVECATARTCSFSARHSSRSAASHSPSTARTMRCCGGADSADEVSACENALSSCCVTLLERMASVKACCQLVDTYSA